MKRHTNRGAGAVEYIVILSFISLGTILAGRHFGNTVKQRYLLVSSSIGKASSAGDAAYSNSGSGVETQEGNLFTSSGEELAGGNSNSSKSSRLFGRNSANGSGRTSSYNPPRRGSSGHGAGVSLEQNNSSAHESKSGGPGNRGLLKRSYRNGTGYVRKAPIDLSSSAQSL